MNILQFTPKPHIQQGGGLYIVQETIRQLLGAKIVDIVPSQLVSISDADYSIKKINPLNYGNYGIPGNLHQLIPDLRKLIPSLIIVHGIFDYHSIIAFFFCKIKNIPYVIFLHGTLDPYVFSYRRIPKVIWMNLIGKLILKEASAVICTAKREAEKAGSYLKNSNVEICPLGIDVPDFTQAEEWRDEIRTRLGISSSARVLLFLGRITAMKRPSETAKAFKEIQGNNWIFLIVGNVSEENEKYKLSDIVDNDKVRYYPAVYGTDKWKLLAASDAFVHLSHRENFCYSVIEAAAAGLPLLISDTVDTFPVFKDCGAADVLSINSINDIRQGLNNFLIKPKSQHTQMGKMAKKVFQENFTQKYFEKELLHLVSKFSQKKS